MRDAMIKAVFGIVFFGLFAFGQAEGPKVSLVYSVVPRPSVVVTNNYSSAITGLIIESGSAAPKGGMRITGMAGLDVGTNFPHDKPILNGESRSFEIGYFRSEDTSDLRPQLKAAVFADGTSVGDPASVSSIFTRRENAYHELTAVENFLEGALKEREDTATVASSLRQMDASVASGPQGTDFKVPVRHVIYMVIRNVEHASVGGEVGNPQRTIPALINAMRQWQGALKPLLRQPQKGSALSNPSGG